MIAKVFTSLDLSIFFEAQAARSPDEATAAIVKWLCVFVEKLIEAAIIYLFSASLLFSQIGLSQATEKLRWPATWWLLKRKTPKRNFSHRHINQTQGVLCSTGLIFTFIARRIVAFDLCEEFKQLRASLSLSAIIKWFLNSHSQIPSIIIDTREIKYLFFFSSSAHILTTH